MTRSEKIDKAKKLTEMNQEGNRIHLEEGYIEGRPQDLEKFNQPCAWLPHHWGVKQIWYINRQGIAAVI